MIAAAKPVAEPLVGEENGGVVGGIGAGDGAGDGTNPHPHSSPMMTGNKEQNSSSITWPFTSSQVKPSKARENTQMAGERPFAVAKTWQTVLSPSKLTKIRVGARDSDPKAYEVPTLGKLHSYCQANRDALVFK